MPTGCAVRALFPACRERAHLTAGSIAMTAQARVAHFLLDVFQQRGSINLIDLPMSRNDIAEHLGLTVEIVCRELTLFAKARIIAIPNVRQIEIIDRAELEALVATAS